MRCSRMSMTLLMLLPMLLAGAACDSASDAPEGDDKRKDAGDDGDAQASQDAGSADAGDTASGGGSEVACIDQSITQLMLFEDPAPAAIDEDSNGAGGFDSVIDAVGGGLQPSESYVYARFEDDGLKQVEVGDEDAFDSSKWHIAFRRYVIRLNSGVSGPGKVTGARTAPKTEFDALEDVPEGLEYRTEQYFNETCDYISDGSGIGAPGTALASFWSYAGCVAMTGNVYVIALDDGRHVKFQVLSYYTPANQAICDETNEVPMPSGAGTLHIRWAFLD